MTGRARLFVGVTGIFLIGLVVACGGSDSGGLIPITGDGGEDAAHDGSIDPGEDAAPPPADGGATHVDSGQRDATTGPGNAGDDASADADAETRDAGDANADAATETLDAGDAKADAATETLDAGDANADATTATPDAGSAETDATSETPDASDAEADATAATPDATIPEGDAGAAPDATIPPVDPCATNHGGCDVHATCAANGSQATCSCAAEYAGDGKSCVPIDRVTLTAGEQFTCATMGSGGIECWGHTSSGVFGPGVSVLPSAQAIAGVSGVRSIGAMGFGICALANDATVSCWGSIGSGPSEVPVPVVGLSGVRAIAAGQEHVCALRGSGSVACWNGVNAYGELGDGSTTRRASPVDVVGLNDAIAVTAGLYHSCALKKDGTVVCWGAVKTDVWTTSHVPIAIAGVTDVTRIDAGWNQTCALKSDGTVMCWGDVYSSTPAIAPTAIPGLTDVTAISTDAGYSCARKSDGTVTCWGAGYYGELGNGKLGESTTPVIVSNLSDAQSIVAGHDHACATRANGTAVCWGAEANAENDSSVPVAVPGFVP